MHLVFLLVAVLCCTSFTQASWVNSDVKTRCDVQNHILRCTTTISATRATDSDTYLFALTSIQAERLALIRASTISHSSESWPIKPIPVSHYPKSVDPEQTTLLSINFDKPQKQIEFHVFTVFSHSIRPWPLKVHMQTPNKVRLAPIPHNFNHQNTQVDYFVTDKMTSYDHLSNQYPSSYLLQLEALNETSSISSTFYSVYPTTVFNQAIALSREAEVSFSSIKLKPASGHADQNKVFTFPLVHDTHPLTWEDVVIVIDKFGHSFLSIDWASVDYEISQLGGAITAEGSYRIRNDGPRHQGQFSRYHLSSNWRANSANAFFMLRAYFPPTAHDIYYRDTIGNISTSRRSHAELVQEQTGVAHYTGPTYMDFRTRFPLYGQWQTEFTIGYTFPSYTNLYVKDNSHYVLNISSELVLKDPAYLVRNQRLRFVLPQGSTDIKVSTPFKALNIRIYPESAAESEANQDISTQVSSDFHLYKYPQESDPHSGYFSWFDTIGRPVVIIDATNIVFENSGNIIITYTRPSFPYSFLKPLVPISMIFFVFLVTILVSRMNFKLVSPSVQQEKLVSKHVEKLIDKVSRLNFKTFAEADNLLDSAENVSREQINSWIDEFSTVLTSRHSEYDAISKVLEPFQIQFSKSIQEIKSCEIRWLEKLKICVRDANSGSSSSKKSLYDLGTAKDAVLVIFDRF